MFFKKPLAKRNDEPATIETSKRKFPPITLEINGQVFASRPLTPKVILEISKYNDELQSAKDSTDPGFQMDILCKFVGALFGAPAELIAENVEARYLYDILETMTDAITATINPKQTEPPLVQPTSGKESPQ